jgi:DNA-binding transcriptional LysR family regulator
VLGLVEQGRQAAREAADLSMRSLRLVAVAPAAEYVVPALLRSFAGLHPEIHLSLEVANRATVFERVLEHEVDVAIAGRPPDDERIAGFAFLRNELALIVAPDDALVGRGSIAPRELGDRVWLQRESGSGTRQLIAEFFAEHDLRPQTLTLGSNGAIKEAVRLGLGVSLQSRVAVEQELASGALAELKLKGGLPEREWYSLHSATVPPRPAVQLFLEYVNGPDGRKAFAEQTAA